MAFRDLTLAQRLVACHTDMMRSADFVILGGITQIGRVTIDATVPTAGTDGERVWYNPEFIKNMSRKQLKYLVCHEAMHKALHHCTEYMHLKKKHPDIFAQAIDYVVNWQLESMDTTGTFLERPTEVPPLIDVKFANMSLPEVMRKLLDEQKQGQAPRPEPMDEHMDGAQGDAEGDAVAEQQAQAEEGKSLKTRIEDAVAQGAIAQEQLRGDGAGAQALGGFQERKTDWRGPLRRFFQEISEGDEQSRYSPPNRRFLPLDIILPSHFSEVTGEIIVACDTSASMHGLYPVVFGEIARICQQVLPASVRILWWDTQVSGEQVFTPKDYGNMRTLMSPRGGGGTTVSCVAKHIALKRYKPKATIYLTDGYVEAKYEVAAGNVLWGVCGNSQFRPLRGKLLQIEEV